MNYKITYAAFYTVAMNNPDTTKELKDMEFYNSQSFFIPFGWLWFARFRLWLMYRNAAEIKILSITKI